MKVLHVIPSVAPVRGGPSQAVFEMVKALKKAGIDVSIVTTNDNGSALLEVTINDWINYQGVSVRFFPRFSPALGSVREFAFSSLLTQWLWQHLQEYDLIHVHAIFSYPSTVAMAIARMRGIPYIVRPLGQLCDWSLQQRAQKKQAYLKVIERANLNGSCGLHLTSSQERHEISRLNLTAPSFVIPHGLQIPKQILNARQQMRSHFNLPLDEPIILFLSRLHPKKGINYLVEALGNMVEQRFTLILAGSGVNEYEETIREWLAQSGLSDRTIMPGFVSGELKQMLLQGADLFALTSHSENFGVAVLEALAAGLPALVTAGVALSELVNEHGFGQVSQLNSTDIASRLEFLLEDTDRLAEMGMAAKTFVKDHYAWERVAEALIKIYHKSIKSLLSPV